MSTSSAGIELAFREIVSFYDNLLKLVHNLQDLLNAKEKLKLDMFNDIDVILKRIGNYFQACQRSQNQLVQTKRQLSYKSQELQVYKDREHHLIMKVNALQNINNKLIESLEQTLKKKMLSDRPKEEQPINSKPIAGKDLELNSPGTKPTEAKTLEHSEENLARSTVKVYEFFWERLRQTQIHSDVDKEEKMMEGLLVAIKQQAGEDYEVVQSCDSLANRIKQRTEVEREYSQLLERVEPVKQNYKTFDWIHFNEQFNLQAELYDKKASIERLRYLYWSQCELFLRELNSSLEGQLKQRVQNILESSQLLSKIVTKTAVDFSAFEDCLLRYRMQCQQMTAAKELQNINKEQTYIPMLKDTVLHEKSLINQLARAFEETNRRITDSKILFKQCFNEITKRSKDLEEGLKDREQHIKNLEKQLDQKKQALEMSMNEGDTSTYRRARRRRSGNPDDSATSHRHVQRNSVIVEADCVLETENRSDSESRPPSKKPDLEVPLSKPPPSRKLELIPNVVNERISHLIDSVFSFRGRTDKSTEQDFQGVERQSEPTKGKVIKSQQISEQVATDPRSSYLRMAQSLEAEVNVMREHQLIVRETIRKMRQLRPQVSEPDGIVLEFKLGEEVIGDISNIVVSSFRLVKRPDKDRQSVDIREFFVDDISPVPQAENKKAFEAYVADVEHVFNLDAKSDILGELHRGEVNTPKEGNTPRASDDRLDRFEKAGRQTSRFARQQESAVSFANQPKMSAFSRVQPVSYRHVQAQTASEPMTPRLPPIDFEVQTDYFEAFGSVPRLMVDSECQTTEQYRIQTIAEHNRQSRREESINFELSDMQPSSSHIKREHKEYESAHNISSVKVVPLSPPNHLSEHSNEGRSIIQGLNSQKEVEGNQSHPVEQGSMMEEAALKDRTEPIRQPQPSRPKAVEHQNIEDLSQKRKQKVLELHEIEKQMYCRTERDNQPNREVDDGRVPKLDLGKVVRMPPPNEFLTFRDEKREQENEQRYAMLEKAVSEKDSAFGLLKKQYDYVRECNEQLKRDIEELRGKVVQVVAEKAIKPLSLQSILEISLSMPSREPIQEFAVVSNGDLLLKDEELKRLKQKLEEVMLRSEQKQAEIKVIELKLEQSRGLEQRVKDLTEDNGDYARRMMENSSYIAKLEIEVKDLTLQLEQLQQQIKDRVIREQQWIRKILQNEEFMPLDITVNEEFLKMVFAMHEKIRHQEIEIKSMLDEFELSTQDSAKEMEEMRKQLLSAIPAI